MTNYDPSTYTPGTYDPGPDPTPYPRASGETTLPPSSYPAPVGTPAPSTFPASSAPSPAEDQSMKDRAAESAQAGQQAAGEVAETAAHRAQDVAQEAKTQARDVLGQAQQQLREQAGAQHRNAVSSLRSLADELSSMAQRSEQSGPATDLVSQAGSRAHSAASWLDEREPGQLVDELRNLGRRKPGVFIAGAVVAGVLAGRLTRGVVASHQDSGADTGATTGATSTPETPDTAALPVVTPASPGYDVSAGRGVGIGNESSYGAPAADPRFQPSYNDDALSNTWTVGEGRS